MLPPKRPVSLSARLNAEDAELRGLQGRTWFLARGTELTTEGFEKLAAKLACYLQLSPHLVIVSWSSQGTFRERLCGLLQCLEEKLGLHVGYMQVTRCIAVLSERLAVSA